MDSQGIGRAMAESFMWLLIGAVVIGGAVAIGAWELFWFLWEHVSFSWK